MRFAHSTNHPALWWMLLLAALVSACAETSGPEISTSTECASSELTYKNFGEPYIVTWCRGCHSSSLPVDMRQNSPAMVNFDDLDQVRIFADRIRARAVASDLKSATMPPAGGPSEQESALFARWLQCSTELQ
jgi:uncharacterized membrane protein